MTALSLLHALARDRSTAPRPWSDLRRDTEGAVMLTGLFMACFLIGSLWFVIGIGDAIVFRDRMQEATDHGAFSSAALQAKGMNFISLCNLVLLVAVTIHIILGIIHDIALAICIVSFGFGCGFWLSMRKVYTGYFKILKPAAEVIHVGEVIAARGYPIMGTVSGFQTGRKYDSPKTQVTVLVVGKSSAGLPVEAQPMSYLCKKIAKVGFTAIFNQALGVSRRSVGGRALDVVKGLIGTVLEFRYCNSLGSGTGRGSESALGDKLGDGNAKVDAENEKIDQQNANRKAGDPPKEHIEKAQVGGGGGGGGLDPGFDSFWGKDGPMTVVVSASNGGKHFQVNALNVNPKYEDDSESRVGLARGPKGQNLTKYTKRVGGTLGYLAQAEFYFDCEDRWRELGCNYEDNATFAIKWRARLRRLDLPSSAVVLGGTGPDALARVPNSDFVNRLPENVAATVRQTFSGPGVVTSSAIKDLNTQLADTAKAATASATKALTPVIGVFH